MMRLLPRLPALCLLCVLCVLSALRVAGAAAVLTADDEKIFGWIVSRDDKGVILRLRDDSLKFIPAKQVKKVLKNLPDAELEKLDPKTPGGYYTLGKKLQGSADPEVAVLGGRLLRIAAHLAPEKYYRKAYTLLYRKSGNPSDKFRYGRALLAYDPNDAELRSELEGISQQRVAALKSQYSCLLKGMRAWSAGRVALAMYWFAKIDSRDVLDFATRETGTDFRLVRGFALFVEHCPECHGTLLVTEAKTDGTGRILCPACKGTGLVREGREKVECQKCRGLGSIDSPESKGTGVLPCRRCETLRSRLKLTPPGADAVSNITQRVLSMLMKGDPDLKSPSMLEKVPASGKPVFIQDDYTRIIYRNGEWTAPQ